MHHKEISISLWLNVMYTIQSNRKFGFVFYLELSIAEIRGGGEIYITILDSINNRKSILLIT